MEERILPLALRGYLVLRGCALLFLITALRITLWMLFGIPQTHTE
jgi:hypothetical protein